MLKFASCFLLCVSVFSSSIALAVKPKDLVGKFDSKVTEPSGQKYEGTCEITHTGGRTLTLIWKYGSKKSIGNGKLEDDVLTVEYEGAIADREGKAVYTIKSPDEIVGEFHRKGTKGIGKETLTRQK